MNPRTSAPSASSKTSSDATQQLHEQNLVLAYHDRSDGGLFTTLAEMSFAGRCGIELNIAPICPSPETPDVLSTLFNEELGAVFQVRKADEQRFKACFATCGPPPGLIHKIGRVSTKSSSQNMAIYHNARLIYRSSRCHLQQLWSNTSYWIQSLRDNPSCAAAEYAHISNDSLAGLSYNLTYSPSTNPLPAASFSSMLNYIRPTTRPRVAILRDQGSNGHSEMAFAFDAAGFAAIDVHMSDLLTPQAHRTHLGPNTDLSSFAGLALCGGFSFGDCLGAGQGWAKSILFHPSTRRKFQDFFARKDTFTLGVCNGCQVLSKLAELIPGADGWPSFERNESEQYEARFTMVKVTETPASAGMAPSVFFHGMHGTSMPISVAHGEGRATFTPSPSLSAQNKARNTVLAAHFSDQHLAPLRYVDAATLLPTETYPFNPNGSPHGIAGMRSTDGRVLAIMPHPERTILSGIASWYPRDEEEEAEGGGALTLGKDKDDRSSGDYGPWIRMFQSARRWVG